MWRRVKIRWSLLFLLLGCIVGSGFLSTPVLAASTDIEANICSDFIAPTITEPTPSTTDDSSITVKGMGEPNMTVAIRDNGVTVATSLIAGDGSYSVQIPLSVGGNVLVARTANDCETKDSASVTVHRNAPPEPPQPPPSPPPQPGPSGGGASPGPGGDSPESPIVGQSGGDEGPTSQPSLREPLPSPIPKPTPGYMQPIITEPRNDEVFTTESIWIAGKAAPFSTISIYVNGVVVATVTADENGIFGAMVQLQPGENTLRIRAALGEKVAFSDSITVHYNKPMEPLPYWVLIFLVLFFWLIIFLILLFFAHRRHRRRENAQNVN